MALSDELDTTIRDSHSSISSLEEKIEALQRDLARARLVKSDALRLYQSTTGSQHPLHEAEADSKRERPRADQVIAAMEAAAGPVTLKDLVSAMPDEPDRGAVSAVVHRAIKRGEVRRIKRGVYELTGRLAVAS
jgi:hypothetical protein